MTWTSAVAPHLAGLGGSDHRQMAAVTSGGCQASPVYFQGAEDGGPLDLRSLTGLG